MLRVFNRETKTEDEIKQLTRMSNRIILLEHENEILTAENIRLSQIVTETAEEDKEAAQL